MIKDPKVIDNDAIVVLCADEDGMTHHDFKLRAAKFGFELTKADCHNMLHRAMGRVHFDGKTWVITAQGTAYRHHVLETLKRIVAAT